MDVRTYCRLCHGNCGLVATVAEGRVTAVRGDHDNPLTRGYACIKGLQYPELHHGPGRLRHSLARGADGAHHPIDSERLFDEVARRIEAIVARHGADAVALFSGTQSAYNILAGLFAGAFMRALGSTSSFSTMTIDQSAKWVAAARLGTFASGRQNFFQSDVWMLVGTNPLVSLQGGLLTGFPSYNPMKSLRDARAKGLKLIVVDPRQSETARNADLHLQPRPGEDAMLFAGLLNIILSEGWADDAFCAQWVNGVADLAAAIRPFTPERTAARTGVPADQLFDAAALFARDSRRGMAASGTGPDMGPRSNLAEHLIESLNAVCGRYARPGDRIPNPGVLSSPKAVYAEAVSPRRDWERGPQSRVADAGMLNAQKMSGTLAQEILTPGEGQIRALICGGGNPAAALPDQLKAVEAMGALELLVTIDPRYSETARMAHYVVAPTLALERPDHTRGHEPNMSMPFGQYTPAIVEPEPGSDVVDDWRFYRAVAGRLGLQLTVGGRALDMQHAPTADELLAMLASRGPVSLEDLKQHPGGKVFDVAAQAVQPPREGQAGRLEVCPPDVAEELAELERETDAPAGADYPYLLIVRRTRELMNTLGKDVEGIRKRTAYNPAWMHPGDLASLDLAEGARVEIRSANGAIPGVARADATLRPGVVSMTHGWGALPGEDETYEKVGANTSRLLGPALPTERINAMPQMNAVPVSVRGVQAAPAQERDSFKGKPVEAPATL